MRAMGPESLMVASRIRPRADLSAYVLMEFPCPDVVLAEAPIRGALEERPQRFDPKRVLRRVRVWFQRRGTDPRGVRPRPAEALRITTGRPSPLQEGTTLAALPAAYGELQQAPPPIPLWAIPNSGAPHMDPCTSG